MDILGIIQGQKFKSDANRFKQPGYKGLGASRSATNLSVTGFQANHNLPHKAVSFHVAHIGSQGIRKRGSAGTYQILSRFTAVGVALNGNPVIVAIINYLNHFLSSFLAVTLPPFGCEASLALLLAFATLVDSFFPSPAMWSLCSI
jgi:hypothetical protein